MESTSTVQHLGRGGFDGMHKLLCKFLLIRRMIWERSEGILIAPESDRLVI